MVKMNIDMPKTCEDCPCAHYSEEHHEFYCKLQKLIIDDSRYIRDMDCPLVEEGK